MAENVVTTDLGFNPDELRAKYREERDKRLRADGNNQYFEVTGDFSHYVDDPYIDTPLQREPLFDEVDVIVVGGGFGGAGLAAGPEADGCQRRAVQRFAH